MHAGTVDDGLLAEARPLRVEHPQAVKHPAIDCFYVYPTVSGQPTIDANLNIDPEERSIALYQAARYSQYCNVYAPMYRQLTLVGIGGTKKITGAEVALPLADVRAAFRDYLAHYNHGRGFVLIGHSQGSFVLRSLISRDVDPKPAVRKELVSAILLGGNVLVKRGTVEDRVSRSERGALLASVHRVVQARGAWVRSRA